MKSTKMEKFQEKGLKDLSALSLNESEMSGVKGGKPWWMVSLTFSLNVQGFFDGSLFEPGTISDKINELDAPQ